VLTNYTIEPRLSVLPDLSISVCNIPSRTRTESNSKQLQAQPKKKKDKEKGWQPVEASSACVDTDEI
jgi:hypothetical protein